MTEQYDPQDEEFDPHAPKMSPDDPRLKLDANKGRTPRFGLVNGGVVLLAGLLVVGVGAALISRQEVIESTKKEREEEELIVNNLPLPASVRDLPIAPPPPAPPPVPAADTMTTLPMSDTNELDEEEQEAMRSDINFAQGVASGGFDMQAAGGEKKKSASDALLDRYAQLASDTANMADGMPGMGGFNDADQNKQSRKNDFINGEGARDKNYLKRGMMNPASPHEVKAGTIIPVSLITGINSDLPGEIIGQVRENVYDTVSGNLLLIPQGSRLMATYDSMVAYGQSRVLVCWNRLIRPDGSSINLECAPGTDLAGYAGFEDSVNNHYARLVGGVLVSSLLSVGASRSQGTQLGDDTTMDQLFASNVGQNLNNAGQQITRKNLEIQPTIEIRPGYSVNVLVNKDMIIPPYTMD